MITYPVSKFQEQFWLLNFMAPESAAYNIPCIFKLNKMPDMLVFKKSLSILFERHETLRTCFNMIDLELQQIICPTIELNSLIEETDLVTFVFDDVHRPEIMDEIHRPFQLDRLPLCRIRFFKYANCIILTIVFHHIIVDLHSKDVFSKEFSSIYNGLLKNREHQLHKPVNQYKEFTTWHNEWLNSESAIEMINEWKNSLPEPNVSLPLPLDNPRKMFATYQGKRTFFTLETNITERIIKFSENNATIPFVTLLACWAKTLGKMSKQETVMMGVPLSNRKKEEFKDTFGCFVNIVPIKVETNTENCIPFIRKQLLFAHRKQEVPFVSILNAFKNNKPTNYNAFFQTGFTFEHLMKLNLEEISIESLPFERDGAQLDLFLTMWLENEQFNGYLEYNSDLFYSSTIEIILKQFQTVTYNMVT